ncbi:hypothetical protein [Asaia sp. HN010]|uniref:hypothetical protein n=1 Tax=Asaia sp. HN010 TaxID=3081233 RepID=UPI00301B2EFF
MSDDTYVEAFRMAREIVPLTNDPAHHLCQVFALASRLSLAFTTGEFSLSVHDAARLFEQGDQIITVGPLDGWPERGVGLHDFPIGDCQVGSNAPDQAFSAHRGDETHSNSSFSSEDSESAGELPTPSRTDDALPLKHAASVPVFNAAGNEVKP